MARADAASACLTPEQVEGAMLARLAICKLVRVMYPALGPGLAGTGPAAGGCAGADRGRRLVNRVSRPDERTNRCDLPEKHVRIGVRCGMVDEPDGAPRSAIVP